VGDLVDRKALRRQYRENVRPAGLFGVRNVTEGVLLVGTSVDLPGMLNRQRFQLELGSHPDKALQADWNRLGADAFSFETLDQLAPPAAATADVRDDLDTLRDMWLQKLADEGQRLYPMSMRSARQGDR
jgi:hypothetical protein